jgi:hypothetical protein
MSVRWTTPNLFRGYGVVGEQYTNNTPLLPLNMRSVVPEIPKPLSEGEEGETYTTHLAFVRWRFSLRLLAANDIDIQLYNAVTGERKLGRWFSEAYEYRSSTGFWSSDTYISPRFAYCFRFKDFELDIDKPCSEPQADLPELLGEVGLAFPTTGAFQPYAYDTVADKVFVFCESPVILLRWGITYDYSFFAYTEDTLEQAGGDAFAYLL